MQSNEDENSANTVYNNIIQVYQEAAELHVDLPHMPRNNTTSLWEGKKMVK